MVPAPTSSVAKRPGPSPPQRVLTRMGSSQKTSPGAPMAGSTATRTATATATNRSARM